MIKNRTTLGKDGSVIIPAALLKSLGMDAGDEIIVLLEDGELRITTPAQAVARAQALVQICGS